MARTMHARWRHSGAVPRKGHPGRSAASERSEVVRDERATAGVLARVGLGARAVLYLLLGVVSVLVAAGTSHAETDQWGAMEQLAHVPAGRAVLWLLAVGLSGYALWRLLEGATGNQWEGDGTWDRVRALGAGLLYAALAVSAFGIVVGADSESQAARQRELTARVMAEPGGRVGVAVVGVAVAVASLVMAAYGLSGRFERQLDTGRMSQRSRRLVRVVGTVGNTARGVVFTLAGALVLDAAVSYSPGRAAGIDAALRTLRDKPGGRELLGAAAAGLICFGLYGLLEVRWHRTAEQAPSRRER